MLSSSRILYLKMITMTTPRILIIDDNPDFGGHQVQAAFGLEGLLEFGDWEILGLVHPNNQKNRDRWESIRANFESRFKIEECPTQSTQFQSVRRHFQRSDQHRLLNIIEAYQPNVILAIQGNIEQCCSVFSLKPKLKCPLLSYIPVPHKHVEMGAKLGRLRDLTCRSLYGIPDGFIAISVTLGDMLEAYGAKGRIQVVENGIPLERFNDQPSQAKARALFNLPTEGFIWGHVGRIEFKQKGQDFALKAFLQRAKSHPDEHLAFIGSGPDRDLLLEKAKAYPQVHCIPWNDNPTPFYVAVDALLMPSRYEGVPLSMLEALANSIPVASTNRDGMRDWLPEAWRFPYHSMYGALSAMEQVRYANKEDVKKLHDRVWSCHTVRDFQMLYHKALAEWLWKIN